MDEGCGRKIGPYDCCTIVTGDARELAKAIPDESVDLIFTDPPYPHEFLPLYSELSAMASKILKRGRLCMAYAGKTALPEAMTRLASALEYYWLFTIYEPGSGASLWKWKIWGNHRPILAFSRGEANRGDRWLHDALSGGGRDKRYHDWGQSAEDASYYIFSLTADGDMVLDPFCGGGTVPAVCKMLGRHYLAFEIDPDVAERARERVRNTQPPLFVLQPEQIEMDIP